MRSLVERQRDENQRLFRPWGFFGRNMSEMLIFKFLNLFYFILIYLLSSVSAVLPSEQWAFVTVERWVCETLLNISNAANLMPEQLCVWWFALNVISNDFLKESKLRLLNIYKNFFFFKSHYVRRD